MVTTRWPTGYSWIRLYGGPPVTHQLLVRGSPASRSTHQRLNYLKFLFLAIWGTDLRDRRIKMSTFTQPEKKKKLVTCLNYWRYFLRFIFVANTQRLLAKINPWWFFEHQGYRAQALHNTARIWDVWEKHFEIGGILNKQQAFHRIFLVRACLSI